MIKKSHALFTALCFGTILSGCSNIVKKDEFGALQQKVNSLSEENNRLKNELGQVKSSVNEVKDRKFVKLPTGSPTKVEARKKNSGSNADKKQEGLTDQDVQTFEEALATYKSGDIANGVTQIAKYRKAYPNGKKYTEATYYLAQAYYAERNYNHAEQVLSPLVFNRSRDEVNLSLAKLLRKVLQASKNAEKLAELDALMNPESVPPELTEQVDSSTPPEQKQTESTE